jgi:hypothetical protein
MHEDAARWDERYASTPRPAPEPPEVVRRSATLDSLVPYSGRCLAVACGPRAVTLWLAARGLDVTALDASSVAIQLLRTTAVAMDLSDRVDARVADLDDGLPGDLNDLDLIVCQRFRDPSLYPVMFERLTDGGVLMITVLSSVGCDEPGPFHARPGELRSAFSGERCEILHDAEGDGAAHLVVRRR